MTASPVLVPHAGVLSNPNTSSGPADSSYIFAPQGQLIQARRDGWRLGNSARAPRLYGGGESADLHPGLVSLPGSASILEPPVVVFSSDREPRRRALSPDGHGGISISLGRELGGDPAQDFTNRHPTLGFGRLRHGPHHEGSHEQEVVKVCRGFGNVCRA